MTIDYTTLPRADLEREARKAEACSEALHKLVAELMVWRSFYKVYAKLFQS